MSRTTFPVLALLMLVTFPLGAQRPRVTVSDGAVATSRVRADPARLARELPGVPATLRARVHVDADSAQRIALHDFDWKGHVSSVEVDEQDSRLFWDVKIVPDTTRGVLIRYRVDATTGGIMDIREFTGVRGLARRPRR